jgi:hypothetical protein
MNRKVRRQENEENGNKERDSLLSRPEEQLYK